MSDSAAEVPDTETPDGTPPTTPLVATDVAPTRKARRRAEVEETPKVEAQPPKVPSESTVSQGGWGYWGNWGKSILSTATATVATVGQGLTQVIEKAETSLGIPSPTEMSAHAEEEERKEEGETPNETERVAGDGASAVESAMGMLTSLSSVVQNTGKTVLSGGLDALEFIGKKTMDVIAEGDPGFKKTKRLMIRNSTLSQVLREAKERELQTSKEESSNLEKKAVAHYGMLFDEYQGLSHLEALEMLSRESESKVKSVLTTLSGEELSQLREELELIKDSFSLMEFEEEEGDEKKDQDGSEFETELTEALEGLSVSATAGKLSKACKDACGVIVGLNKPAEGDSKEDERATLTVEEVNAAAIRSLAELTARSIELFHKLAESILLCNGAVKGDALSLLTVVLCKEVSLLSKKFTACLTAAGSNEKGEILNPLITGVFLEASNSASYIQDAFQLLMPILELSHIQRRADTSEE